MNITTRCRILSGENFYIPPQSSTWDIMNNMADIRSMTGGLGMLLLFSGSMQAQTVRASMQGHLPMLVAGGVLHISSQTKICPHD